MMKGPRLWMWVTVITAALLIGVFGDTSHAEFLAWSWMGLGMDKIAHMLYMGALATVMSERWKMWTVVLWGTALAIAIEFVQPYFHRDRDMTDAAWGIVGTWWAWGLYQLPWYRRLMDKKIF